MAKKRHEEQVLAWSRMHILNEKYVSPQRKGLQEIRFDGQKKTSKGEG